MKVTCSVCKTVRSVQQEEINTAAYSTITCATCGSKIKLIFCGACGKCYSVTYNELPSNIYNITCKACGNKFTEVFGPKQTPEPVLSPAEATQQPDAKETETLLSVLGGAFTKRSLGASLCFIGIAANLLAAVSFANKIDFLISGLRLLCGILIAAAYCAAAGKIASSISVRNILRRLPTMLGFCSLPAITLWAVNFSIAVLPPVHPVLFAVAFAPIYAFAVAAFAFVAVGFWLYPPFAALSPQADIKNFFSFIKTLGYKVAIVLIAYASLLAASLILLNGALLLRRLAFIAAGIFDITRLTDYVMLLPNGISSAANFVYPIKLLFSASSVSCPATIVSGVIFAAAGFAADVILVSLAANLSGYLYRRLADSAQT